MKGTPPLLAFVDDFDVPGAVALAFQKGMLSAYTSSAAIPKMSELASNGFVEDLLRMAAMYVAVPIDTDSDGCGGAERDRSS